MTRGKKVIAFIQRYCRVPEGDLLGKPVQLMDFQQRFIRDVYDNPSGTSRAYLTMARKNGKTGLIACLLLAHIVGPEAYQNSRITSGARTRKQAAEVFNYAWKMVMMSPELSKLIKAVPSEKKLVGLAMNVEYQAISADAKGAHGGSPIVAILDEVGQIRGPTDAFVEAIETSQGAYDGKALLIAISTQAPTANDLFSRWLDDAERSKDPRIVSHVYAAPEDCALDDRAAWRAANPALGVFRSLTDVEDKARQAARMPSDENSFRWLYLNQRIEANSPFITRGEWQSGSGAVAEFGPDVPLYGGLDLSAVHDLTALVLIGRIDGMTHVRPWFWLPAEGLAEKSVKDRVPYDVWAREGHLLTAPGKSVDYEYVAVVIRELCDRYDIRKIAFDRWGFRHLRPWLVKAGFTDDEIESYFEEFGQGTKSMTPALRELKSEFLNGRVRHGNHPVLAMCARNAVVVGSEEARKLVKDKSFGRIDGMVALTMAMGVAPMESVDLVSVYETRGALVL